MGRTILLADSGATKTTWALLTGKKITHWHTQGISPYLMDVEKIEAIIRSELPASLTKKTIQAIYFYGTGCKATSKARMVKSALQHIYPDAEVHVTHDLMASAVALCGTDSGIACILGTGSGSCYYNGKRIVGQSPGLGYVLGDEGSGAYFGKILVRNFLYASFDEDLHRAFSSAYRLDRDSILQSVYREPLANRFLAGLSPFLSKHRGHYMIENIIEDGLREFFELHLKPYSRIHEMPVHFVGGIAWSFRDILRELCSEYGYTMGTVMKQPIEGLIKHHLRASHGK
ncbi:MAG: N-acetylglucosamine kinase [Bacteroidetes bacterium]|nr:N-acetylglucosamine kinase [Bacteroidota bacterium]